MQPDRIIIAGHSLALAFAFSVALLCPRPGDPALLVPLGSQGLAGTIAWAEAESLPFVSLDMTSARVVALVPDHGSVLRALGAGIVPIAAEKAGCAASKDGENLWKN